MGKEMADRDDKGQFVKGHSGGPGRPPKQREEKYYDLLMTSVPFERWVKIVRKAAEQAERGDQAARTWLSNYLVGKPDENMNLKSDSTVELIIRHVKSGL